MNLSACWSEICSVDVAPLAAWLAAHPPSWPEVAATKPGRVFVPPEAAWPIIHAVCAHFPEFLEDGEVAVHQPMLSRMPPGEAHPMHVDTARADWLTRVHVPLLTNEGCWFQWEQDIPGVKAKRVTPQVHFEVGKAYTFDMTRRHAFDNDGDTERVHLLFDVLRSK